MRQPQDVSNHARKERLLQELKSLKDEYAARGVSICGLFGSLARGEEGPTSDIDVAIRLESDFLQKRDVWDYFDTIDSIRQRLTAQYGRQVDVFDLDSNPLVSQKIQKEMIHV